MGDTDIVPVSRLIALVRQRPVLWDRQQEVYKNRKLTRKAWTEICEDLIDGYDGLTDSEKKATGKNVIGKWANLRDNWLRYWRKRQELLRIGSPTKSLKKYIHHDQLLFLSKVYDDQEIEQEVEEIQVDVDVISDPEMDSPRSNSSQNLWDISSEENRLEENHFQPQAGSHLYFFHSIMPMICEFNNDQVLDFQSAVLESIKRIKFGGNYVNITPGHTLPLLALIPAPVPAPVIKKEQPSNVVSIATNTVQQLQQIKQESDDVSKNKNSTVLQTKETLPIPSVCDKIEKCPLLKLKTNETKHMQELKQDSADLSHLQRVIYKLERISKRFVTSHFKSSYCQYGAYIESLLRGLSPRNIQYLKRNIVKEILRVKSLEKQKKSNSKKKSTQQNTCYTEMQKDDVTLSTPHTSKELSSLSNQSKDINIEIPSLRDKNNSLYQVPNNKSSDLENNNLKSLGSCSTSLKGVDSFNQNNQTNFTSSEGNMYSCQQKREFVETSGTKPLYRTLRKRQKILNN